MPRANSAFYSVKLCNLFHEIFKFRENMNTLRNFSKSDFAHKQFILTESPDHVLQNDI